MSSNTETSALQLATIEGKSGELSLLSTTEGYNHIARIANNYCRSQMVPAAYRGADKLQDCIIAADIAMTMGANILSVMQNLHVIQGRPSWSSQFVISLVNASRRFTPLRYKVRDLGKKTVKYRESTGWDERNRKKTYEQRELVLEQNLECVAYAQDIRSGEVLEGPEVTYEMAVREGWWTKADSKWQTMPTLMLRYRAAAFFARLYCPEVLNGMGGTVEEAEDIMVDAQVIHQPAEMPRATSTAVAEPKQVAPVEVQSAPQGGAVQQDAGTSPATAARPKMASRRARGASTKHNEGPVAPTPEPPVVVGKLEEEKPSDEAVTGEQPPQEDPPQEQEQMGPVPQEGSQNPASNEPEPLTIKVDEIKADEVVTVTCDVLECKTWTTGQSSLHGIGLAVEGEYQGSIYSKDTLPSGDAPHALRELVGKRVSFELIGLEKPTKGGGGMRVYPMIVSFNVL